MDAGTRLTNLFLAWGDIHCLPGNECLHSFLAGGTNTVCLGMSACTTCTPSWLGGLTYELLTATTLIYAYGAGITMADGTRLTHFFPAWGG